MNQISFTQEIKRKIVHLLIGLIPLSYFFFSKEILFYIFIPICVLIVGTDYLRQRLTIIEAIFNQLFAKILRHHEKDKLSGSSYFSIATIIIFIFFNKITFINAFLILAISDSLAAIIGRSIKSRPFFEKSLAGSLSFLISSLIITLCNGLILNQGLIYYLCIVPAILTTTIIEARPSLLNIDDNFTIPISFALTFSAFFNIWT